MIEIPIDVAVARATATLEKGVLEVVVPRRQEY
jgi:HSP20 family molecular chaperone IbpA